MKRYLFVIGLVYAVGAVLHLLDVLDLRMQFSTMGPIWKVWTLFLLIADSTAALGLIRNKKYGEYCFLLIALAQLVAYTAFTAIFGQQYFLIAFHLFTLSIYSYLKLSSNGGKSKSKAF